MMATAIFATSIVVIIGLTAPLSRKVDELIDSDIAARLAQNIEGELKRVGYAAIMESPLRPRLDPAATTPLYLYASPDARRVVIDVDAGNPLETGTPPGLAERDRYFRVRVLATTTTTPDPLAGWLSLRADVTWPHLLPEGPASDTAVAEGEGADLARPVEPAQQQLLSYFFALNP